MGSPNRRSRCSRARCGRDCKGAPSMAGGARLSEPPEHRPLLIAKGLQVRQLPLQPRHDHPSGTDDIRPGALMHPGSPGPAREVRRDIWQPGLLSMAIRGCTAMARRLAGRRARSSPNRYDGIPAVGEPGSKSVGEGRMLRCQQPLIRARRSHLGSGLSYGRQRDRQFPFHCSAKPVTATSPRRRPRGALTSAWLRGFGMTEEATLSCCTVFISDGHPSHKPRGTRPELLLRLHQGPRLRDPLPRR